MSGQNMITFANDFMQIKRINITFKQPKGHSRQRCITRRRSDNLSATFPLFIVTAKI